MSGASIVHGEHRTRSTQTIDDRLQQRPVPTFMLGDLDDDTGKVPVLGQHLLHHRGEQRLWFQVHRQEAVARQAVATLECLRERASIERGTEFECSRSSEPLVRRVIGAVDRIEAGKRFVANDGATTQVDDGLVDGLEESLSERALELNAPVRRDVRQRSRYGS